jgi:hypothetical protein
MTTETSWRDPMGGPPAGTGYPVTFDVEPQTQDRNRLTVLLRFFLAIPHGLMVGHPPVLSIVVGIVGAVIIAAVDDVGDTTGNFGGGSGDYGILGIAILVTAIISWFAIVIAGAMPSGLWRFHAFYMGWRSRARAYLYLLRDEFPPFGEGAYPVTYEVEQPVDRTRWTVLLRFFLLIPHFIVLLFLNIALYVTTIIAWFAILFTGAYPTGLYKFAVGVSRWDVRVESYFVLLVDQYPPFSLDP